MASFIRLRAGRDNRPSRKAFIPTGTKGEKAIESVFRVRTTSDIIANGTANHAGRSSSPAMNQCFDMVDSFPGSAINVSRRTMRETEVTDRSLTRKQNLELWPTDVIDSVDLNQRLLDKDHYKKTGQIRMGSWHSNARTLKRTDKTLLRRGIPTIAQPADQIRLKRQTSKSKSIRWDEDMVFPSAPKEKPIDLEDDSKIAELL